AAPVLDTGNTTWMMVSAALVLLMTPGLAFFYGGMVRGKNVLAMLMHNVVCMGVISILWVFGAYSLAFNGGGEGIYRFIGKFDLSLLSGNPDTGGAVLQATLYPTIVFAAFQLTFAIITPALISGGIAERVRFAPFVAFVAIWAVVVYAPIAHWVWGGGWLAQFGAVWNVAADGTRSIAQLGVEDFAGGTVVHINAGIAALALILIVGKRIGWRKDPMRPHNIPFVMLGAGLLWFGWLGFNAGSELGADSTAGFALFNSMVAPGAAMLAWIAVEKIRDGHATTLGAASGIVAGLVAITPACGFVDPKGAIWIGLLAGAVCALAVGIKFKLGFDDSLDVIAVHLIGGILGALSIGFFGNADINSFGRNGLFYGGGLGQLGRQAVGVTATIVYGFIMSMIIGLAVNAVSKLRATHDSELEGLDTTIHGESAYETSGLGGSRTNSSVTGSVPSALSTTGVDA
ncbi:MAG: ammonium transporter, Amt family, partial [Frankiaceae bacterium]|nr:ammonium transporter, Amt family [Frankiaceae bacterium]